MPGYGTWKQLFAEERIQLYEEGYDLTGLPAGTENGEDTEEAWEQAYHTLFSVYGKPLRADYPYVEPNDFETILSSAAPAPKLTPLSGDAYEKRLRGGVIGRIAGVILGKPLEIGPDAARVREYLIGADAYPLTDFVPASSPKSGMTARGDCIVSTRGNITYAQPDDDIHYTLLALLLAEQHGFDFSAEDVGRNWLDNVPYHWFWCASRQAYYHMVAGNPVSSIPTNLNPWRECIDGQIRCDLWGYLAPSDLRLAAKGAYRDCAFSLTKNGIYGGMYVAGCVAAALSENPTVDTILDGGLAVIPENSRLAEAVRLVRKWYRETPDFDAVCAKIYEKYGYLSYIETINNLSVVTLAVLAGNLDYEKTIIYALYGGMDTDCNAGTAGSIVGCAVGIDNIDPKWYTCLNDTIRSNVAAFGQTTISDVIDRILARQHSL